MHPIQNPGTFDLAPPICAESTDYSSLLHSWDEEKLTWLQAEKS